MFSGRKVVIIFGVLSIAALIWYASSSWYDITVISIVTGVLSIIAVILAFSSWSDSRELARQFGGGLNTPAVQLRWGHPEGDRLLCHVTAIFSDISDLTVSVGNQKRHVGDLRQNEPKPVEFSSVPQGRRFQVKFVDPIEKKKLSMGGVVRYGKMEF